MPNLVSISEIKNSPLGEQYLTIAGAAKMEVELVHLKYLIQDNESLQKCTPDSIQKSFLESAALGMSLNKQIKECTMVARWNKRKNCHEANLVPMYQGMLNGARKHGDAKHFNVQLIHENDFVDVNLATGEVKDHKPAQLAGKEPGAITGVYAIAIMNDSTRIIEIMWMDEINKVRNASDSYRKWKKDGEKGFKPIWVTWFEEMCKKTVLRRLCKRLKYDADSIFLKMLEKDNEEYSFPPSNDQIKYIENIASNLFKDHNQFKPYEDKITSLKTQDEFQDLLEDLIEEIAEEWHKALDAFGLGFGAVIDHNNKPHEIIAISSFGKLEIHQITESGYHKTPRFLTLHEVGKNGLTEWEKTETV